VTRIEGVTHALVTHRNKLFSTCYSMLRAAKWRSRSPPHAVVLNMRGQQPCTESTALSMTWL